MQSRLRQVSSLSLIPQSTETPTLAETGVPAIVQPLEQVHLMRDDGGRSLLQPLNGRRMVAGAAGAAGVSHNPNLQSSADQAQGGFQQAHTRLAAGHDQPLRAKPVLLQRAQQAVPAGIEVRLGRREWAGRADGGVVGAEALEVLFGAHNHLTAHS